MDKKGIKHDDGKLRMDLIPVEVEEALANILTHGAKRYGDHNWKQGLDYWRVYGAIRRHLAARVKGEIQDKDSGMPHLWHALTELAFLVYYDTHYQKYKDFDSWPINELDESEGDNE